MGFEFAAEHVLIDDADFRSVLHELRDETGNQMLTIHMDVHRFAPSVLKRMEYAFRSLRIVTDAPIFAIEDIPFDPKWQRYVARMGFEYSSLVKCTDGQSRRCFVSKKNKKNEQQKHSDHQPDD